MTTDKPICANTRLEKHKAAVIGGIALRVFAGVVVLLPVVIAVRFGSSGSWFDNPFNGFGMWGVFVIYLWTRPARKEALLILCAAAVLRMLHAAAANEAAYPGSSVINIGLYLPLFCLPILAYRSLKGPNQPLQRLSLGGVLLLSYIGLCLGFYTQLSKVVCHARLDYLLYEFDGALGPHVNFMIAKAAASFEPLRIMLDTTYYSLGFFVAVLLAAHINVANNKLDILKLNVVNSVIGFTLYFVFPASGPKYAFSSFPETPGSLSLAPGLFNAIPNAMPSLHFATALLLFFVSRPWKWLRWVTGAYLALMALAVFSTGEHYVIDVIVAMPYSLIIMAASSKAAGRKRVLMAGAGMLGMWLLALRFGAFNAWTSWGLALITIAAVILIERRFANHLWLGASRPRQAGYPASLPSNASSLPLSAVN